MRAPERSLRRALPALALIGLLFGGVTAPATATPEPTDLIGRASTAGRWLVDPQGRVIVVHGENVVSKTAPFTPQSYGFDAEDAQFLQDNQFDGVRLGIVWEAVEPQPGVYDDRYLDAVASTVTMLAAHHIRTLVEFHQDRWGSALGGAGAPAWATDTGGLPDVTGSVYASLVSPAVYQAFSHFFANSPAPDGRGLLDHFTDAWTHVAQRLRTVDGIVGYGILNEPFVGVFQDLCLPGAADCPPPSPQLRLRRFQDGVEAAIRAVDPAIPIFESEYVTAAAGVAETPLPPTLDGIVHSYNSYAVPCTSGLPTPVAACAPFYDDTANKAADFTRTNNRPSVLTEFGATDNPDVLRYQTNLADHDMTSWFHWNFGGNDPTTTAASPQIEGLLTDARRQPTADNINQSNLDALSRPYPSLISGTPESWQYGSTTADFTFTYNTRRADGTAQFPPGAITTIAVPPRTALRGTDIRVTGGHVAADRNGQLDIASDGSAQTITVEIRESGR